MWASAAHLYIPFDGLHQTTVRHLLRLRPTPFPAAMPRSQAASHHLIPIPRIGVWHQLCSGRAAAANGSGCSGRFLAFSHFSAPNQTGDVWGRRQNCTFQKSHISLFSLLFKAIFRLGNSPLTRRAKMPFKSETQAHRLSPPCMVPNVLKIWATACTYFNSFRCGQVKAGEPLSIQYKYCVAARLKDGITQQFWEKKTFAFLCLQPTVYVHGTYIGLKGDRSEERKIKREEGGGNIPFRFQSGLGKTKVSAASPSVSLMAQANLSPSSPSSSAVKGGMSSSGGCIPREETKEYRLPNLGEIGRAGSDSISFPFYGNRSALRRPQKRRSLKWTVEEGATAGKKYFLNKFYFVVGKRLKDYFPCG